MITITFGDKLNALKSLSKIISGLGPLALLYWYDKDHLDIKEVLTAKSDTEQGC